MQDHGNRSQITGELPQSRPRRARPTPQNQAQAFLDGVRHRLDTGDITASSAAEHIAEELFHWNTAQASAEPIDFGDCRGFEMPPRRDPDRGDQPPADSFFAVIIETKDAGPRRRREIVETVRKLHRKHVESRAKADGETTTTSSGAVIVEVHRPQPDERRVVHRLHLTACRSAVAAAGGADSARGTAPRRPARTPETKIVYGIALGQPTKGHLATIARAAAGPGRTGRSHTTAEWAEAIDVRPVSDELFQRIRNWFAEASPTTKPVDNQLGLPVVRGSTPEDDRFTTLYLVRIVFLLFLQQIQPGTKACLDACIEATEASEGPHGSWYREYIERLFFDVLDTAPGERNAGRCRRLTGHRLVPHINGGLFRRTPDETDGRAMPAIHARKLNDILDDYHVTIDENAAAEQECAVHPELLGNVFERLLAVQKDDGSGHAESARSGRGTYYTPSALTAHIVAETLSRAVNDGAKNEDLYDLLDPSTEAMPAARLKQVAARHPNVGKRIRRLTVLDPACGSGGFLIAAAAAIEASLARLAAVGRSQTTTRTPSRYEILRDNVRGIDVDANAVNIARLRLYLHHLMDPGRQGRAGDSKLPRLDLVVQVGDGLAPVLTESVVGEAEGAGARQPSFGDMLTTVPAAEDRYQRAAKAWFDPESDEDRARRELDDAQKGLREAVEAARDDHFGKTADATRRRLRNLPDGEVGHTGGLDARVAFGETKGFDAIIGNPPYVALQKMGPEQQTPLRERFGDDYVGRGDVYMLFMAHVPKLLRENGIWSLLVSQTWLQNDAGRRTRDKLRPHVLDLSTFGGGWFNDATVAVAAVTARPTPVEGGAEIAAYALDRDRPELPPRDGGAKRILYTARSDGWTLVTRTEETLIEKIRAYGPTLAERERRGGIKIQRGITTNDNDTWIIPADKARHLIAEEPQSANLLRPIARGRDCRRWAIPWDPATGHYMIWIPRDYPEEIEPGRDPVETLEAEHPALMRLLRDARRESKTWWNTWPTYEKAWAKPKVIWMDLSQYGCFAYDEGRLLTNNKAYAIYNAQPWLCALLNSRTYTWFARRVGRRTGAYCLEWTRHWTAAFNVPNPSSTDRETLNRLCREMAGRQRRQPADADDAEPWSTPEEREIDDWMARHLNLTTAERAILDAMTRHE